MLESARRHVSLRSFMPLLPCISILFPFFSSAPSSSHYLSSFLLEWWRLSLSLSLSSCLSPRLFSFFFRVFVLFSPFHFVSCIFLSFLFSYHPWCVEARCTDFICKLVLREHQLLFVRIERRRLRRPTTDDSPRISN